MEELRVDKECEDDLNTRTEHLPCSDKYQLEHALCILNTNNEHKIIE